MGLISRVSSRTYRMKAISKLRGEFAQLTERERVEIVAKSRELFDDPARTIIAGSGCESPHQTIDMTNEMADVGADVALVITPSYYKSAMQEAHMLNHFR